MIRGRRGVLLAALGASAAVSFASIGLASASASASASALASASASASALGSASRVRMRVHNLLRDQPPLAHTGGFGEPTCLACHMDGELNEEGGVLLIDGLPSRYQPGRRYTLGVMITHPELRVAGFELSARYESGPDSARQAGTLTTIDDRAKVTIEESRRVQYAHHMRPGTAALPGPSGKWTVVWTAPEAPSGPVVIHIAANAGNDNDSPMGDYIYARSFTVPSSEK